MFNKAKKIITTLSIIGLFLSTATGSVNAQMMGQDRADIEVEETHDDTHESLEVVLAELLDKYRKDTIQDLDCDDLTENELERLGDAVMESMHPGEAHEAMDEMMGGEGSESLKNIHINMGQRYLGCSTTNNYGMGMMGGMMEAGGRSMMNDSQTYNSSRFNKTNYFGVHAVLATVTMLSMSAFLLAGARWFWKKPGK